MKFGPSPLELNVWVIEGILIVTLLSVSLWIDKVTLNGWSTGETEISIFWSVTVSSWALPLSLELSCPAKAGADVVDMMKNSKSTALMTGFTLARKSGAV